MSVVVNTSFFFSKAVAHKGLAWIKDAYRSEALKFGASDASLMKVIGADADEAYALHLSFPSFAQAEAWNDGIAALLRHELSQLWGENALAFTTYLQVIE